MLHKNFNEILKIIDKPQEFKRFSGFESQSLWDFLLSKINIQTYGEIGCPRWGLFELAKKEKKKLIFIENLEKNFWGKKCIIGKKNCNFLAQKKIKFKKIKFKKNSHKKIDLVGIFQYLDHVRDPLKFIRKILLISKNQAFIVDRFRDFDNTVYIQHFTGWSKKPFEWVAKKFQRKIFSNFYDFKKTENNLFLIMR